MDGTRSPETTQAISSHLAMARGADWVSAEQLRLKALVLLESTADITIDFTGVDSLDTTTLHILIALEIEQGRKDLALLVTGASAEFRHWFASAGADGYFMISDPLSELNTKAWDS
jgi:anti-anti-sigma regulatory factor